MRRWAVALTVVAVLALVAGSIGLLWWLATRGLSGGELATARLEAVKVGLSIGVGGGGGFALYLAWRRQRSNEADHAQRDRIAAVTEFDATERRITDLYTKAVEQLGAGQAPVRLGGLYALERLAQNAPAQRQTIVNVVCAYLRMPYTLPGSPQHESYREREEERHVRFAAQRILTVHLRPGSDEFWGELDVDLTGAVITELDLTGSRIRHGRFSRAHFTKDARFAEATFTGSARFAATRVDGAAHFTATRFLGESTFDGAKFNGPKLFDNGAVTARPSNRSPHGAID